jgi:hypothetical protein
VGAPVVDLLKAARLGCEVTAVTITGGERTNQNPAGWNVPKQDLMGFGNGLRSTGTSAADAATGEFFSECGFRFGRD